ncbi:interleukin-2 receptor subunit alpha [Mesocricetus auratus]|uniref:Interleukin-2 receptor subunit alpha n=1 Tax=Mesocricetus auratus TaxID=10036 RepID=A0ABM2YCW0_MESAU|nr:interleukin-2 receptor subunit alpha [Mesocricetus auratus]
METHLVILGLLSFIMIPSSLTEMCMHDPPKVAYATFKAPAYKNGTILNCECKRGFRRIKELVYMVCLENSWSKSCQCSSNSNNNPRKQATPNPEDQKDWQTTEMQKSTQSVHQGNLPGHCGEPPTWEHEDTKRIYHFVVGQRLHYECIQGYKALQKGPAMSICKMICGKTEWTQPQLTCVDEREHHQFPASEESQGSRDSFPESETSCPITTTDFQLPTKAATTMETFILTMEYQIAVASCVFLLISILLLSGLTWQRRWKKSRRTI